MRKLMLISIIGLLLGGCGKSEDCAGKIEAFVMSQKAVRNNLKSPSTAEFPSITERGVQVIGDVDVKGLQICKYEVLGFVDAQNSFGGTIRSRYLVGLEYTVKTQKWRATTVTIE